MARRQPDLTGDFLIAALYRFVDLPGFADLQEPIHRMCEDRGIRGTLLLAPEGINGTIAGAEAEIRGFLAELRDMPPFAGLEHKESRAGRMPFRRLKVRLKKEIVTLGLPGLDPVGMTGTHVEPADWNALLDDPDVVVIDTRNDYEVAIGTFDNAVDPRTSSFRQFPQWLRENALMEDRPKVAMFCTGGIRCEKASALLRQEGFEEVYQLKGGILKYLETVPPEDSRWRGECFVFDERVSVVEGLETGTHSLCRACRMPLGEADRQSPDYREGISCPRCIGLHSDADRARFAERHRQMTRKMTQEKRPRKRA
ncbi:MAG TPA: rhodanese-related sulfurtransferase [Afifellaceae bacterium]|nr:rhodanese-related sulfurtransferase [Afifellaceae bacterium]